MLVCALLYVYFGEYLFTDLDPDNILCSVIDLDLKTSLKTTLLYKHTCLFIFHIQQNNLSFLDYSSSLREEVAGHFIFTFIVISLLLISGNFVELTFL